jgi:hypothetical protein
MTPGTAAVEAVNQGKSAVRGIIHMMKNSWTFAEKREMVISWNNRTGTNRVQV